MSTFHSYKYCQVEQANAQTKTWKRVCLFNRTTVLENQIDQWVYQLYDLTEEEIAIVKGSGK